MCEGVVSGVCGGMWVSDWRDVVVVEVVVVWVGRELVVVITSRPPSPQAPVGGAGAVVRVMVGVPGGQLVGGEGQQSR